MKLPKYQQVAAVIRDQIADGGLPPGTSAPSGAALARATGYSVLTCRHALRTLIEDGTLAPGASRHARRIAVRPGGITACPGHRPDRVDRRRCHHRHLPRDPRGRRDREDRPGDRGTRSSMKEDRTRGKAIRNRVSSNDILLDRIQEAGK